MSAFKVGQRVRVLPTPAHPNMGEGVIVEYLGMHTRSYDGVRDIAYSVRIFGCPYPYDDCDCWWVLERGLRPLTDPKADAFIERIKNLKPYDEPVVAKHEWTVDRI